MAGFRIIEFGQCGLLFERPGQNYVLKVAQPNYEDALWTDITAHFRVRQAFDKQTPECQVPRVFSNIPKTNQTWWDADIALFPRVHGSLPLPAMTLVTERIHPLPKVAREALINI